MLPQQASGYQECASAGMAATSAAIISNAPSGHAAESQDELAASHSITSLANASSRSGTLRPSAFAVFRLITSSNLIGCWTGRSDALAPLRILSTYDAVRTNKSISSGP